MKMTGRQIKRDICRHTGLRPKDLRVRWGTGTASCWLDVMIANELYQTMGEIVELVIELSPEYGYGSYDSDFDGQRHPAVSISNFDGIQRLWSRDSPDTKRLDEDGAEVDWRQAGF